LDCATVAFSERYCFHMVTEKNRNSLECGSEILTSSLSWLGGVDLWQEVFRPLGAKHQWQSTSAELIITSGWDDVSTNYTASSNDRHHEGSSCDGNTSSITSAEFYLRKDRSEESSVSSVHVRGILHTSEYLSCDGQNIQHALNNIWRILTVEKKAKKGELQ